MKELKERSDRYYKNVFNFVFFFLRLYIKTFAKITTKPIRPKQQFILLANHLTERDFFIICNAVRTHMYIVVSEHFCRSNVLLHRLILRFMHPVCRAKGMNDIHASMEMLRRLKRGNNLLVFPEGHRSADGCSMHVDESIGKLVQKSGCSLITFRIVGGYMAEPRWTSNVRKGEITGGVVGVYSPEELKQMTSEEVCDIVNRDIYEDAYARQAKDPKPYKGKNLAEGMENHLFLCPNCKRVGTLKTSGDTFSCDCGMHGTYDEYAMLSGDKLSFTTVRDWTVWQKEAFLAMSDETDGELARDTDVTLYRIDIRKHESTVVTVGDEWANNKELHIGELTFPFSSIYDTALMNLGNTLYFQTKGGYYELYGKGVAQIKYQMLWEKHRHDDANEPDKHSADTASEKVAQSS